MAEEEGGIGVEYEIEVTILESNLPMLHDSLTRENITIEKYPDLEIGEYGKIFNSIHTRLTGFKIVVGITYMTFR